MSEKELIERDLEEAAQKQRQEQLKNLELYHWLKENGYILFESVTGSQAHGTNISTSDIDRNFVYILPKDDILGLRYKEQLKINKDFMGYEIRRFLELLRKNNPTILELMYSPDDCMLIKHPAFDILMRQRDKFITKTCKDSFYGYARQQREKAEGLEKLQNWEMSRVTKKTPLDFCNVPVGYDSIPLKTWLDRNNLDQLFCALTAVDHCRELYALFYDYEAYECFSEHLDQSVREANKQRRKDQGLSMGLGYKGISFEESNDIRLSNIPMEERRKSLCHVSYNKDGYRKSCKDYARYQTWLENRNEARWVETKEHGQQIDGKNMMHFMRLILIGKEIAQGKGINIRRPDAAELLKIRRGEIPLQELFDKSDELLVEMKALFQESNLPNEVSEDFIHHMLVNIRHTFYKNREVKVINGESDNYFIQKRFGNLSELQCLMRSAVEEHMKDMGETIEEVMENYEQPWLNVIPSDLWPEEDGEPVDTENVRILKSTRDKVTVVASGDWQEGRQFEIVMWGEGAAVINVKKYEDHEEDDVNYEDFFKQLGYASNEE